MAINAADIRVKFSSENADGVTKDIKSVGSAVDQAGEKSRAAGTKLTAFATIPIAGFFSQAFLGASGLQQAQGKVNAVFEDSAGIILDWSETSADSFGLSQTKALSAAGTYGQFFSILGLGKPIVTDMSKQMVGLAADVGAFNDISTERANEALQSALIGEYDALQRYGIILTEATVQQEALNMGLADTASELTEADKMQARYNLILKQAGPIMGQFERESKGAAGSLAILKANLADAVAELGEELLPIGTKIIKMFTEWVDAFRKLDPGIRRFIVFAGLAAAALGPLLIAISLMLPALALLVSPIGLVVLGIAALVAGFIYAYTHFETFRNAVNAVVDVMQLLWNTFRAEGWSGVFDLFVTGIRSVADSIKIGLQLAWDAITALDWSQFVPTLVWDFFVAAVDLATFVGSLVWSVFVTAVDLTLFVANLAWDGFVTAVRLADYVFTLLWTSFVKGVQLFEYVVDLVWSAFVKGVDLVADGIAKVLDWADFINPLNWPSPTEILAAIADAITGQREPVTDDGYQVDPTQVGGGNLTNNPVQAPNVKGTAAEGVPPKWLPGYYQALSGAVAEFNRQVEAAAAVPAWFDGVEFAGSRLAGIGLPNVLETIGARARGLGEDVLMFAGTIRGLDLINAQPFMSLAAGVQTLGRHAGQMIAKIASVGAAMAGLDGQSATVSILGDNVGALAAVDASAAALGGIHGRIAQTFINGDNSNALGAIGAAAAAMAGFDGTVATGYLNAINNVGAAVGAALADLARFDGASATAYINVSGSGIGAAIPGFAEGGYVRSSLAMVGEEGPELVSLPIGSYVHTAGKTERMLAGMGGTPTITIHAPLNIENHGDVSDEQFLRWSQIHIQGQERGIRNVMRSLGVT